MLTSQKNDNSVSFNLIKEAGIQILKTDDLTSHLLSVQTACIRLEVGVGKESHGYHVPQNTTLCSIRVILPKQDVYKRLGMFRVVTVRWKMLLS